MKQLLILRHAKSDKGDLRMRDFERPLNHRGTKAASLVGDYMGRKKLQPDLAISSPAERARQTAVLAFKAAGIKADLRFDERIYEASATQLLQVVKQIDESANFVLLVGHNPGFEDLLSALTGHIHHMPTAALALLALDVQQWNDVRESCAELEWIVTPKDLERE